MVAKARSEGSAGAAPGLHEVARLFPPMTQAEFEALKEDIGRHGLREPITTSEGEIVDGIHRDRACRELGIEPRYVEWSGEGSLLDFAVGRNLHRRHLTESQRAMVAARIANLAGGRPAKTARKEAVSEAEAAARMKVGRSSVQKAKQVLGRGDPGLVAAVERDEVSVSAAARVAELGREEQAEVVAQGPAAIKARARQLRRGEGAEDRGAHRPCTTATVPTPSRSTSSGSTPSRVNAVQAGAEGPQGDRAWLEGLPVRARLRDPAAFDREALGWRRLQPLLDRARREHPGFDGEVPLRMFSSASRPQLLSHVASLGHPRDWRVCPSCGGTGAGDRGGRCESCRGDGFVHHAGRRGLIAPAVGPILGVGSHDCRVNRPDGFGSPDLLAEEETARQAVATYGQVAHDLAGSDLLIGPASRGADTHGSIPPNQVVGDPVDYLVRRNKMARASYEKTRKKKHRKVKYLWL